MNELNGYDIEDIQLGMNATFAKTITEADIVLFAAVSGDNNAMHINEEFAQTTAFKGRVKLETLCTVANKVVIEGDALVMPTSRAASGLNKPAP